MAGQQRRQDPKETALAGARCLNPHPEQVTDPEFLASDFFDARDAVQVKYEMVRKARAGGAPVTEAAAAFGYSRPAYYAAAAALEASGLDGLVPARPGRAEGSPPGLGVLARGGVPAWRHALAGLAPAGQGTAGPPGTGRAPSARLPVPVAAELISALAAVALAGATTGPLP